MRGIHVRHEELETDSHVSRFVEINFSPAFVVAKTSMALYSTNMVGGAYAALWSARRRDPASGKETLVSTGFSPIFWGPDICSVTFTCGLGTFADSHGAYYHASFVLEVQFW